MARFKTTSENAPFPDLKLDTLPVPLEVKIELWLERETYSQFSARRLEISTIYHLRTLESLETVFASVSEPPRRFA